MVNCPAHLAVCCSVDYLFLFPFSSLCYFTAIFFSFFLELFFSSFCISFILICSVTFTDIATKRMNETTFYGRAISNTAKANGNAISTETMLVDNHLKTFLINISLLWLHLYCGLDTSHNNTMITLHCILAAVSYSCVLGTPCFFLWASNFLLLSKSIFILFVRFFPLSLSVTVITSAKSYIWSYCHLEEMTTWGQPLLQMVWHSFQLCSRRRPQD